VSQNTRLTRVRKGDTGSSTSTYLADLSATELLDVYARRVASPVDAVKSCLERIDRVDKTVNAVLTVDERDALQSAHRSERRWRDGTPRTLEGIPFGAKDVICTAGLRTTGGSKLYEDYVPSTSATGVRLLEDAGAVLLCKLQTFEFARGDDTAFGRTLNPFDFTRSSGGSSSGSGAALAAREIPLALGTDTGGSIRVPASFCGVVGLKPTLGRVSRTGVFPQAWTLDHLGAMARSAEDVARAFEVLAQYDPRDPSCRPWPPSVATQVLDHGVKGLRIGVPVDWFFDICSDEMLTAVDFALDVLVARGAVQVPIRLPHAFLSSPVGWAITYAEFAALHAHHRARISEFGDAWSQQVLADSQFVSATDYLQALRAIHVLQHDFQEAFDSVDAIIVPTVVGEAPLHDDLSFRIGGDVHPWDDVIARNTMIFNLTGMPALSVPAGFSRSGLPLGLQISAPPGNDDLCLRIAHSFQQDTRFHRTRPRTLG
jgi:aspartyl-tRNA(Asn)/glutamyl-tRNA(Gln) amidotransferase subunit A